MNDANPNRHAIASSDAGVNNDWPQTTIIVPVRNGAGVIEACMDALLSQDYPGPKPEIIVVDNNSSDNTPRLLEKYGELIRVLSESTRGASAARNTAIRTASHELIAMTDADCVPRPNWLRELVSAAQRQVDASFVGGRINALNRDSPIARFAESLFDQRWAIEVTDQPYMITANVLARRSKLLSFGLFDVRFLRGQDCELSFRARFRHGAKLAYCDTAVIDHINVNTLLRLWHKGIQHGAGSALLAREFAADLGITPRMRMKDLQHYKTAARETVGLLRHCFTASNQEKGGTRNDAFYSASFQLARHLSFIFHSLLSEIRAND